MASDQPPTSGLWAAVSRTPKEHRWLTFGQWASATLLFASILLGQVGSCARMNEIKRIVEFNTAVTQSVKAAVERDVSELNRVSDEHIRLNAAAHKAILDALPKTR